MWFELLVNVIIATVIFCWWFLSRCGRHCQTFISLQCTRLYLFHVRGWLLTDTSLSWCWMQLFEVSCGTCVGLVAEWCWLCPGEWVPISGAGNSASFSPSGPSSFYPQPPPDVKWFSVSYKGSYGLSSVNKNNMNPHLVFKSFGFLETFLSELKLKNAERHKFICKHVHN